jgi:osmoprotectant transport system ATP-binding protein
MIELIGVQKAYDSSASIGPLDLHIETGKTTVLIGPSGCGKSTLLRMITGLITPTAGRVLFDSVPLTASNLLERRRSMGYVIQEGGLFAHLTARRNVTLMARYVGRPRERIDGRVDELAELVRLSPGVLARYPTELSGGERQRVSLMRALMLDPQVLLLDEPLAALDPIVRFDLQTDLKQIFQKLGKTVVLVTHDIAEAAYFAGEIVLMRQGSIVQRGTLNDLLERPATDFVTRFVNAQRTVSPG